MIATQIKRIYLPTLINKIKKITKIELYYSKKLQCHAIKNILSD